MYRILIVFFLVTIKMNAQKMKPWVKFSYPIDTVYREPLFDFIQFKVDLNSNVQSLTIYNEDKQEYFDLKPNEVNKIRISLDYKFLGLTYNFTPSFLPGNNDDDYKGNTKYQEYEFRFFLGRFYNNLSFTNIKGFYLIDPTIHDSYVAIPDFKTKRFNIRTHYIFGDKFSLRAIKAQTEKQKKSAGSFVASASYNYQQYEIGDNITTQKYIPINLLRNEYTGLITGGYYRTQLLGKDFYLYGALEPGAGVSFSDNVIKNDKFKKTEFIVNFEGQIGLGYNSKNFFTGVEYNYRSGEFYGSDFPAFKHKNYFQFFIGFRLNAPKVIRKPFEWVEKRTGF